MNQVRKLKRDNKLYIGVFYTLNGVLVIVFASMNLLKPYLFVFFGLLLGVVGINILFSLRTKNPWYLVTSFHYLTLAIAIWAEFNSHDKLKKYMLFFCLHWCAC